MDSKTKDTWSDRDREAWQAAAAELESDGWVREPDMWRGSVFHKDGKTVALVRSLGMLNWHPVDVNLRSIDQ